MLDAGCFAPGVILIVGYLVIMSYKKLDVWKLARELVIDIHKMTL